MLHVKGVYTKVSIVLLTFAVLLTCSAQPALASGFWWWMLLGQNNNHSSQRPEQVFGSPITFFSDTSCGMLNVKTGNAFLVKSDTGYLEIILSPVERATFIDGKLYSYTFLQSSRVNTQRATVSQKNSLLQAMTGQNTAMQNVISGIYFFASRNRMACEIKSIDNRSAIFFYNEQKRQWDIRILQFYQHF